MILDKSFDAYALFRREEVLTMKNKYKNMDMYLFGSMHERHLVYRMPC